VQKYQASVWMQILEEPPKTQIETLRLVERRPKVKPVKLMNY
jgi:hypothetical protein